jgi:tripeptidyl-peptidase-1
LNDDDKTETAVNVPAEGFWSGGGFSNEWAAPDYQKSTLAKYFADTPPPYDNLTTFGTPYYNKTGRGYPDVSAIGLNVLLYIGGIPTFVGGTSASAPIFASIITLINEQRLAAGKKRVGFLNPTLYKNPQAFTDITTGSNPGCGLAGFEAVEGWDPVTGLGTPKFDELLKVFMALP